MASKSEERGRGNGESAAVFERIEQGSRASRRQFLAGASAAVALVGGAGAAHAAKDQKAARSWAATPPEGFVPFSAPGKVVKVSKAGTLQPNGMYPKADDAKAMLERVMTELTGKKDLVAAVRELVHPKDIVCVKVNGIAGKNMSTAKELVVPFIEAMIQAGVPATSITVLEQYGGFLAGTRVNAQSLPAGVSTAVHQNAKDNPAMAPMDERMIAGTGVRTRFVKPLTDATCAINFALIKDHSICGYTGALKNMTHGCTVNPHDFHVHHASPQIALLYAQDVIKSRTRLAIADGYKVMAHGGPLWKQPQYVKPYEAVLASTDPVAIDAIGWEIVEKLRKELKLKSLTDEGRPPAYIKAAADLGLGIDDRSKIQLKEVTL